LVLDEGVSFMPWPFYSQEKENIQKTEIRWQ
jgi:hypothetical protein